METSEQAASRSAAVGVAYGLGAFVAWGLCPIYFKAVAHVPAEEVLAHRVVWSVLFLLIVIMATGRRDSLAAVLRQPQVLRMLMLSTLLIAVNWFVFIWAIARNELMQASLGYFINPLMNVLLGFLFFRERLRSWQKVSVVLAAIGVLYLTINYGRFPWIALVLATSFGFYGLVRKVAKVGPMVGLTLETGMLLPLAIVYLVVVNTQGQGTFLAGSRADDLLLASAGVVTAVPLLWFTNAARRLRLSTVGFLQYLAPTGQFLLAVFAYGEAFSRTHAIAFSCIWAALLIYSVDTVLAQRRRMAHEKVRKWESEKVAPAHELVER